MLNVPVSKIVLNEPRIRALVGQGEAASVAQHMRMGKQGQGSGGAVFSQGQVHGGSVQRLPLLAYQGKGAIFSASLYGLRGIKAVTPCLRSIHAAATRLRQPIISKTRWYSSAILRAKIGS